MISSLSLAGISIRLSFLNCSKKALVVSPILMMVRSLTHFLTCLGVQGKSALGVEKSLVKEKSIDIKVRIIVKGFS
jgi:hypothetical protein